MIHMRKKGIFAVVLAVMLMMIACTAVADKATVTASSLYMRMGPDSSTEIGKVLRNGAELEILGKDGNWYEVAYGKYTGYVYKDYIYITKTEEDTLKKGDTPMRLP